MSFLKLHKTKFQFEVSHGPTTNEYVIIILNSNILLFPLFYVVSVDAITSLEFHL